MKARRPFPLWRSAEITPESAFLRRRELCGLLAAGPIALSLSCAREGSAPPAGSTVPSDVLARFPAERSPRFTASRPLTPSQIAGRYNNYYEFTTDKERVAEVAAGFATRPWRVEVSGLCARPQAFDIDELIRAMPMEERIYRFRCVEAWAMVVPWTGFPLAALLDRVEPNRDARFVRFVSFPPRDDAPGMARQSHYPWPYHEALRIDEARHDLAMLATGVYGRPLPNQHGAPLRLVVPWKYGFKSIKGVQKIELTAERPPTFWNRLQPREYSFLANIDPDAPHPRWSQAKERMIDTGAEVPTRKYNGYDVGRLYA